MEKAEGSGARLQRELHGERDPFSGVSPLNQLHFNEVFPLGY